MSTHSSAQELLERYVEIVWRALCSATKAVGEFALRVIELGLRFAGGIATFIRAIAWLVLVSGGILIASVFGVYLLAHTVGLSESPTFQEIRETVLQKNLAEIKRVITLHTRDYGEISPTPTNEQAAE